MGSGEYGSGRGEGELNFCDIERVGEDDDGEGGRAG